MSGTLVPRCTKLKILVEFVAAKAVKDPKKSRAAQMEVAKKHGKHVSTMERWLSKLKKNGVNSFLDSPGSSNSFMLWVAQRRDKGESVAVIARNTGLRRERVHEWFDLYKTNDNCFPIDADEIEAMRLFKELKYTVNNTVKTKPQQRTKKAVKAEGTKATSVKAVEKAPEKTTVPKDLPVQLPIPYTAGSTAQTEFQRLNLPREVAAHVIEVLREIQAHAGSKTTYEVDRLQKRVKEVENVVKIREKRIRELNTEKATWDSKVAVLAQENAILREENAELKPVDLSTVDMSDVSEDTMFS